MKNLSFTLLLVFSFAFKWPLPTHLKDERTLKIGPATDAPAATLYVGSLDGNFYAIDAMTGLQKWSFKLNSGGFMSSATAAGGSILVGGDDKLYAFDAETGAVKWSTTLVTGGLVYSSPVVANGLAFVCRMGGVNAVDVATGKEVWKFDLFGPLETPTASPVVKDGTLFLSGWRNNGQGEVSPVLYALAAVTGETKWTFPLDAIAGGTTPVDAHTVYAADTRNKIYAIDKETGRLRWQYQLSKDMHSHPVVRNQRVYGVMGDDILFALNSATGALEWSSKEVRKGPDSGYSISTPAVGENLIYFASNSNMMPDQGVLVAVDAASGLKKWSLSIDSNLRTTPFQSSPTLAGSSLYVCGPSSPTGGKIYAVDAQTGAKKWEFVASPLGFIASPLVVTKAGSAYHSGVSGTIE